MEATLCLLAMEVFSHIHLTEGTETRENYWSQGTGVFSGLPLELKSQHNVSSVTECASICDAQASSFYAFAATELGGTNCILLGSLSEWSSPSDIWMNDGDAWTIYHRSNVQESVRIIAFRFPTDNPIPLHAFFEGGDSSPLTRFPEAYDRTRSLSTPFKSEALVSLEREDVRQIRLQMWKSGETVVDVSFNATGRGKTDWVHYDSLLQGQWSDLTPGTGFIHYESNGERYFTAKKSGRNCVDVGWFVVVDAVDVCPWGRRGPFPKFLYSTQTTAVYFGYGSLADDFVLLVDIVV